MISPTNMDTSKTFLKLFLVMALLLSLQVLCGCAGIDPMDAPKTIIKNPLGTDHIRIGMTKQEIVSVWGEPDQVNILEPADEWQTIREEWVYLGRYTKIPLDKSYLFKTKYLIFDGNNLVCVGDKSQCEAEENKEVEGVL